MIPMHDEEAAGARVGAFSGMPGGALDALIERARTAMRGGDRGEGIALAAQALSAARVALARETEQREGQGLRLQRLGGDDGDDDARIDRAGAGLDVLPFVFCASRLAGEQLAAAFEHAARTWHAAGAAGDETVERCALIDLASIYCTLGEHDRAAELATLAIDLARKHDDASVLHAALCCRAYVVVDIGRRFEPAAPRDADALAQAQADAMEALQLAPVAIDAPARASAHLLLGAAHVLLGQHDKGMAHLERARAGYERSRWRALSLVARDLQARARFAAGDSDGALAAFAEVLRAAPDESVSTLEARHALYEASRTGGHHHDALIHLERLHALRLERERARAHTRLRLAIARFEGEWYRAPVRVSAGREHVDPVDVLARRTRELAIAQDAAQRAARVRTVFLARASHALRTPLHGLIGFLDLAARAATPDACARFVGKGLAVGRLAADQIADLLELSHALSEPAAPGDEALALAALAQDAVEAARSSAAAAMQGPIGIEIAAELAGAVRADRAGLHKVLRTLVVLARRASPQGALTLSLAVAQEDPSGVLVRAQACGETVADAAPALLLAHGDDDGAAFPFTWDGPGLELMRLVARRLCGDAGRTDADGRPVLYWASARVVRA